MPMAIPTRSMSRKRRPRSRTKLRVPWVRLASQGAPMKPIHRPRSVDTTYHSGGHRGRGDRLHLRRRLAGDGAGDEPEDQRADLADEEADERRRPATSSPGAWSAGGTQGVSRKGTSPAAGGGGGGGGGTDGREVGYRRWRAAVAAASRGRAGRPRAPGSRAGPVAAAPAGPIRGARSRPGRAPAGGRADPGDLEAARRARNRSSSRRYRCPEGPRPAGGPASVTQATGRSPPCRGGA